MSEHKLKKVLRCSVVSTALTVVAGCSSVADYKQPITDLNASIDSSVATVIKIDSEITESQNRRWRELIGESEAFLVPSENSCAAGSKSCSLVVIASGGDTEKSFPAKSMMPKAIIALSGLRQYADNLKAIVDADTAASVATSANAALASAAKIEAEIAKANNPDAQISSTIKAYSPPITASISWLVSQYIERQKVKALATATERAQPVIEDLAVYYETAAAVASSLKDADALDEFVEAQGVFDNVASKSNSAINEYLRAVKEYDTALKASSSKPMQKFLEAHTALNGALNGSDEVSLADAIAAIKEFKRHSKDFKESVDEYVSVAKGQQEIN